jgi:1,4-dihydroxy-2-naphthoate octaprenyltransferase
LHEASVVRQVFHWYVDDHLPLNAIRRRLGRARAVRLYVGLAAAGLAVVPIGVACGLFPRATLAALLALPLLVSSARSAIHTFETPRLFVPAIRSVVRCYLAALLLFIGGILLSASPLPG